MKRSIRTIFEMQKKKEKKLVETIQMQLKFF